LCVDETPLRITTVDRGIWDITDCAQKLIVTNVIAGTCGSFESGAAANFLVFCRSFDMLMAANADPAAARKTEKSFVSSLK
jgi:hypothetical protein